jgi:uncharacterized membrane protein YhhN
MINFLHSPSSLYLITALIAASAFLHLYGAAYNSRQLAWPFKPLPVFLLMLYVLLQPDRDFYSLLIATGLFFSLIGDLFLLNEERFFIQGLVAFLMAHLFYIGAFWMQTTFHSAQIFILLPITAIGLIIFRRLRPNLHALTVPVVIYMTVIVIMVWRAFCRIEFSGENLGGFWWAALGALLFMTSDACLAWHKFYRPLKHRDNLVMLTYYAGQFGIALSAIKLV